MASRHLDERGANLFPLYLRQEALTRSGDLFDKPDEDDPRLTKDGLRYNLSDYGLNYLQSIGTVEDTPALFHHAIAILHSPAYRQENAGALRQDWPRVPLPGARHASETSGPDDGAVPARERLLASAELGRALAELLDPETPVSGVTTGKIRPELRTIGVVSRVGGGSLRPDEGDLAITAGWGYAGARGVTMPGGGKRVERPYSEEELAAFEAVAAEAGTPPEGVFDRLGESTFDIYLNDVAFWKNIPARVWDYTLGGYPVIKKWLSYREQSLLGRSLTPGEAREVRDMARRIAAILLMEPALNANYRAALE